MAGPGSHARPGMQKAVAQTGFPECISYFSPPHRRLPAPVKAWSRPYRPVPASVSGTASPTPKPSEQGAPGQQRRVWPRHLNVFRGTPADELAFRRALSSYSWSSAPSRSTHGAMEDGPLVCRLEGTVQDGPPIHYQSRAALSPRDVMFVLHRAPAPFHVQLSRWGGGVWIPPSIPEAKHPSAARFVVAHR